MLELVGVILTQNEERHIAECVASLRNWVDAVLVWDGGSTDETHTLAKQVGALFVHRPFDNFAAQRQAVLDTIDAEWILFVDADERVTPELGEEIRRAIQLNSQCDPNGYWLSRRNFIVGYEFRGGGFYPDYQLRLLRRDSFAYDLTREVHEVVILKGDEGHLQEPLLHYNYASWPQFYKKQAFYAQYEARILAARGIRPRPHNFILQPLRELKRRFITLQGWKDGPRGLHLALLLAWYYGFMPYWYLLWEWQLGSVK